MIKTNRGNTPLACAILAAGLLNFSAQSVFAANATVKAVRGTPKYMGTNGFAVTIKKGDKLPAGTIIKTGANDGVDLAIGERARLVSMAPNSTVKLNEGGSGITVQKGEVVGSFRKLPGEDIAPLTMRTPTGATEISVGDLAVNADTGVHSLLSGNNARFQALSNDGAPSGSISFSAGSIAMAQGNSSPTVSRMSEMLTANLLARVDSLNNVDQSLEDLKKKPSACPPPTTTPASPEPEPGDGDGTGTQGYWKNHAEAWPVNSITIGGVVFTQAEAIAGMQHSTNRDVTYAMFQQLVAAKLNILAGNQGSCVAATITAADAWMAAHPLGSRVTGGSSAWGSGENGNAIMSTLDDYNNGRMCAPHRD